MGLSAAKTGPEGEQVGDLSLCCWQFSLLATRTRADIWAADMLLCASAPDIQHFFVVIAAPT